MQKYCFAFQLAKLVGTFERSVLHITMVRVILTIGYLNGKVEILDDYKRPYLNRTHPVSSDTLLFYYNT